MAELLERFKMETNFEGLIQLLAKSLYQKSDVFVRELIQNAHDSIVRRREIERDLGGHIEVMLNPTACIVTVRDNGIGMDLQDIKEFLAVIGSTGTGVTRQQLQEHGREAAYQLIGQFGIGMLSAFVVADKVIVHTRKLGVAVAFAWHNTGSTDCELFADDQQEVGTKVEVVINPQYAFMLDERRLREAVIQYCDFIPFPISLNGQGPVNTLNAPWHRTHWTSSAEKEASYYQFLKHRYPDVPLDVIPVEIDEPYRARGVLYISDRHVPDVNTTGVVDIFVRRMFVCSNDTSLLPPWAKFVRGVVDSPDLQPTAARDYVQRNHPSFDFLQQRLGELIVERLSYLARHEPRKFRQINQWHHYHLKGMAYYYDDFFTQVAELLLFETNRGPMALQDYLTKNASRPDTGHKAPIYYFAHKGAAPQFYRLADARSWVVIDAGWIFEEELLQKYARHHQDTVHLERLDATDDPELFQRLDEATQEHFRQLELDLEGYLHRQGLNVSVRMRRFAPAELPAIIILTPESEAEELIRQMISQPWIMEGLEEVVQETLNVARQPIYLSLNVDNPLIQKLANIDRRDETVRETFFGVYNSAVLYSHNLLTQSNAHVIHGQVVRVLGHLLAQREQLTSMSQTLEQERRQLLELRQRQIEVTTRRPDHILLFMITPFADEYRPLEQAVRRVFERPPYCFEVRLARDYTHKPGLLDNVREHMMRAHGFLAEVSDLNPNVMFELGAAMLPDDGRPVFTLRRADATLPVPADFKEKLFVPYGTLADSVETLEASLRSAFEKDGRITHDGIREFLRQQQKHFLSRMVLEDLQIRLQTEQIAGLLKHYNSIEDLLAATPAKVAHDCSVQDYLVVAIQGALRERLGHD